MPSPEMPGRIDAAQLDARLMAMTSREDKVAFAKQNGYKVLFRKNPKSDRLDFRIQRDGRDVDSFDSSMGNAGRIMDMSEKEIASRLSLIELDAKYPGVQAAGEKLSNVSIGEDEYHEIIKNFNAAHAGNLSGMYTVLTIPGFHNTIIKYFENGSASIEGSY